MRVDRWKRRFFRQLEDLGAKPLHQGTPQEAREFMERLMDTNGPGPVMHRIMDHEVAGSGGFAVPVRVLVPVARPRAVVVYLHGGGWVTGSISSYETIARKLAERSGCAIVLVDYRLAPEHPYPAAVEDSYRALEWVSANLNNIAGGDVPLILVGDDAGGNLAAVISQRARDLNGPPIALQILVCPIMDDELEHDISVESATGPWVGSETMQWFWHHYLPDLTARSAPDASPLRAKNLSRLPPAVVVTAEASPARAGGEAYARRLAEAGVQVDAHRYDGQLHNFFALLMLPQGEKVFQLVINAIKDRAPSQIRGIGMLRARGSMPGVRERQDAS